MYRIGAIVEFASPFALPDYIIPARSRAKVIDIDPDDGTLQVRLDNVPPELWHTRGIVSVRPKHLNCIKGCAPQRKRFWRILPSAQCLAYATAAIALLYLPGPELFPITSIAKAFHTDPISYNQIWLKRDHYHAGENLEVEVNTLRNRPCIWQWSIVWERVFPDGREAVVAVDRHPSQHVSAVGSEDRHSTFERLPTNLTIPGQYEFNSDGVAECDHGEIYTYHNEVLRFWIDPANS